MVQWAVDKTSEVTGIKQTDQMQLNVQTIHGQMHVGWSYYTHVWSDETAEQFVKIFREELDKFGEK